MPPRVTGVVVGRPSAPNAMLPVLVPSDTFHEPSACLVKASVIGVDAPVLLYVVVWISMTAPAAASTDMLPISVMLSVAFGASVWPIGRVMLPGEPAVLTT